MVRLFARNGTLGSPSGSRRSASRGASLALAAGLALASLFPGGVLAEPLDSADALPEAAAAAAAPASPEAAPADAAAPAAAPAYPEVLVRLEAELLERTNAERAKYGLAPLAFDPAMLNVARTRATEQIPLPALSHTDSTGQLVVGRLLAAEGVTYRLAGENLARLYGADETTATRASDALMDSPKHRKNILETRFDRIAIGAVLDPSGRIIYAQIFRGA